MEVLLSRHGRAQTHPANAARRGKGTKMSNSIEIAVPHNLGVAEARRRINAEIEQLRNEYINKFALFRNCLGRRHRQYPRRGARTGGEGAHRRAGRQRAYRDHSALDPRKARRAAAEQARRNSERYACRSAIRRRNPEPHFSSTTTRPGISCPAFWRTGVSSMSRSAKPAVPAMSRIYSGACA